MFNVRCRSRTRLTNGALFAALIVVTSCSSTSGPEALGKYTLTSIDDASLPVAIDMGQVASGTFELKDSDRFEAITKLSDGTEIVSRGDFELSIGSNEGEIRVTLRSIQGSINGEIDLFLGPDAEGYQFINATGSDNSVVSLPLKTGTWVYSR